MCQAINTLWDDSAKSSVRSRVDPQGPHRAPQLARATESGSGSRLLGLGLGSLLLAPANTR